MVIHDHCFFVGQHPQRKTNPQNSLKDIRITLPWWKNKKDGEKYLRKNTSIGVFEVCLLSFTPLIRIDDCELFKLLFRIPRVLRSIER